LPKKRSSEAVLPTLIHTSAHHADCCQDHKFRQSLSPIAKRACAIVARIRLEEQRTTWTSDVEEELALRKDSLTMYPGMMFTLAKRKMEATKLWQIIRRMPKGALLHAHCDAMVDFDYLFQVVLETPGMHISSPDSNLATVEARKESHIEIRFQTKGDDTGMSIWTDDYKPGTFIPLTKAADEFPVAGRAGFLSWLKSRCVISQTEAIEQHHGVAEIWRKFAKCFRTIGAIIHYEPIWRKFLQRLMKLLLDDGIYWVEIRYVVLHLVRQPTKRFFHQPAAPPFLPLGLLKGRPQYDAPLCSPSPPVLPRHRHILI
jgi:adenosine deaminase CECR1